MNSSEGWASVYKLISAQQTSRAIELCQQEPYSSILQCQRYLGWEYYKRHELDKALYWFTKGADQGDGESLSGIGAVHWTQKNYPAALQYWERAVDLGFGRASNRIGSMYLFGIGVPKDIDKAIYYSRISASLGYFVGKQTSLQATWHRGNILAKLWTIPQSIYLLIKIELIARRNINDPRLADARTFFDPIFSIKKN